MALDEFIETFNQSGKLCTATSLLVIEKVIECAGLPTNRVDAEEFVRSFMVSLYGCDSPVTPEFVFTQYHHAIKEEVPAFSTTYGGFLAICERPSKNTTSNWRAMTKRWSILAAQREAILEFRENYEQPSIWTKSLALYPPCRPKDGFEIPVRSSALLWGGFLCGTHGMAR